MTKSHALAFALVVSAHVVALAAWDQHLTRHYAAAFVAKSENFGQAPTVTVVATRRAAPEGDFPRTLAP